MKVLVLGAGVIGTSTAWYLTQQGHEVVVVDRRELGPFPEYTAPRRKRSPKRLPNED